MRARPSAAHQRGPHSAHAHAAQGRQGTSVLCVADPGAMPVICATMPTRVRCCSEFQLHEWPPYHAACSHQSSPVSLHPWCRLRQAGARFRLHKCAIVHLYVCMCAAWLENLDISRHTRRTTLIFGSESVAWVHAIDSEPKMRSVRGVGLEKSCLLHLAGGSRTWRGVAQ